MEVTPELSDGYEGVVRKLVCLYCLKPFYIARDDYERIHPQHCHSCSLQCTGVEHRMAKKSVPKEAPEQTEQGIQHPQAEDVKVEVMSPEENWFCTRSYKKLQMNLGN